MDYLAHVKTILEINDNSKDDLLGLYISRAMDYIVDYCKIEPPHEIPTSLDSVIEEMAVFQFRQKGVENIQSEGKGSLSESYLLEYPPNIMNRLRSHRRVVIL